MLVKRKLSKPKLIEIVNILEELIKNLRELI